MMLKYIKNLILYDFKNIYAKRNIIFLYIIISSILIVNLIPKVPSLVCNYLDFYGYIFMNSSLIAYLPCILSIYFSAIIFFNNELDLLIKIRIKNKYYWLISKLFTMLILNLFIIILLTMITLIIGIIYFKLAIGWGENSISLAKQIPMTVTDFKYTIFYSPLKLILINSGIYTLFMTFISLFAIIVSLVFKMPKLAVILPSIYLIVSFFISIIPNFKLAKFLNSNSYIMFGYRNYYKFSELSGLFLTFRQAFFIPLIFLIILVFISLVIVRKIDFGIGEKRLWD